MLLGVALTASATEVWRWKDANGVVHYSDSPVPGAERVSTGPAPKPGANTPPVSRSVRQADNAPPTAAPRYTRCEVTKPANDLTFRGEEPITASVAIEPMLQPGHRIEVTLNGSVYPQWTGATTTYTFAGLYRGSYALAVRVLDANGATACAGPAINFYIQQPTLLSPARQQPAKPIVKPPPPAGPGK
jgi:hypothetical protein